MEPKIEPSALEEAISALKVIRTCLKADTGDVGEYWSAREWLRNHDRYEDNLQELAVPLEVAEVALMNIEALEHAPSSPAAPRLKPILPSEDDFEPLLHANPDTLLKFNKATLLGGNSTDAINTSQGGPEIKYVSPAARTAGGEEKV